MTICEDCGDDCVRRTRCKKCKLLICRWCYHHTHNLEMLSKVTKEVEAEIKEEK